jgi:hypothetical protein
MYLEFSVAAQDHGVDPAPVHHGLQAWFVEKHRLARHAFTPVCFLAWGWRLETYSAHSRESGKSSSLAKALGPRFRGDERKNDLI